MDHIFSVHHKFSIFGIKYVKKEKNVFYVSLCTTLRYVVKLLSWEFAWIFTFHIFDFKFCYVLLNDKLLNQVLLTLN